MKNKIVEQLRLGLTIIIKVLFNNLARGLNNNSPRQARGCRQLAVVYPNSSQRLSGGKVDIGNPDAWDICPMHKARYYP